MSVTRRNFIQAAVASALAAASFRARSHMGRGWLAPPPASAFDYYISPTGSAANAGTLAAPWDISVFAMTPSSGTAANFQSLMAGKRIGMLPGTYPVYPYWSQQFNDGASHGSCLTVPSGTAASPTYVASCDASGNYSPRTATIDAHPLATTGQASVTLGVSGRVSAVTVGTTTLITFDGPPEIGPYSSNPFAVGDNVWFDDCDGSGNGWPAIGISSGAANTPAPYYSVTAVGGAAGAWTITVNVATSGTWTPGNYPSVYKNYPSLQGQIIGNTDSGASTSGGYWTLDGLIVTGAYQDGVGYFAKKYVPFGSGEPNGGGAGGSSMQIAGITTGSSTTFTIAYTGTTNPYSVNDIVYFVGIQATGTGETLTALNLNPTTQNRYTITAIGGASGAWTFTINTATSGTYVTGTTAYVGNQGPPVTIQNCEIFDCEGAEDNNPAGIHMEVGQGCLVSNCKIHDCMLAMGELNEAGGAFLGFDQWDLVVEYCTMYNVQSGVYNKSLGQGNITVRSNYIQTTTGGATVAVNQGQGQVIPGMALKVHNNILVARNLGSNTESDAQKQYAGSWEYYQNTWYWPFDTGNSLYGPFCLSSGGSTSGPFAFTPPAQGSYYNNLCNPLAGGSQLNQSGYVSGMAAGTATAPTTINIALCDYNGYDASASTTKFALGKYSNLVNFGLGTYTLATWQSEAGFDAHSAIGTPTYASTSLGYQYPTSNFQLASGSFGKGAGRIGGTSGGTATDLGAWGGIDVNTGQPPAQIGSNF